MSNGSSQLEETVAMLNSAIDGNHIAMNAMADKIAELEATVAKAFLRCQALEEALDEAREVISRTVMEHIAIQPDWSDGVAWSIQTDAGFIRRSKVVYDRLVFLCHAAPVPGCETSSPSAPQSGDGEAR